MNLADYSADLSERMRLAIEAQRLDYEVVTIPLKCACGVAQFLQAHEANLRDVERLNQLDEIGSEWRVIVRGEIFGVGRIRDALDQAIARATDPDFQIQE